jgi:hypothetical protein
MARQGNKAAARELANGLTYPREQRLEPRLTGTRFNFKDDKTWSFPYEASPTFSGPSHIMRMGMAADLFAAAVSCRVALVGRFRFADGELPERWDALGVVEILATAEDVDGALAMQSRLPKKQRLLALLVIADKYARHMKDRASSTGKQRPQRR